MIQSCILGIIFSCSYSIYLFIYLFIYIFIYIFTLCQVRGHGAAHDAGQDSGRGVLAVGRAGDRPPGPRHRLQLLQVTQSSSRDTRYTAPLQDLPPEPAGGQAPGTEGNT